MTSSLWAPLIHGRTWSVDYRDNFLVVPEDFGNEEIQFFKRFVLATTSQPKLLIRNGPRWFQVKTSHHWVVGITCMASDVFDEMVQDEWNRPLYYSLAFVTRSTVGSVPEQRIENFAAHARFVRARWLAGPNDLSAIARAPYDLRPLLGTPTSGGRDNAALDIAAVNITAPNERPAAVKIFPPQAEAAIWRSVAKHPCETSLCTGLPSVSMLQNGPFQNAVCAEVNDAIVVPTLQVRREHPNSMDRDVDPNDGRDAATPFGASKNDADASNDENAAWASRLMRLSTWVRALANVLFGPTVVDRFTGTCKGDRARGEHGRAQKKDREKRRSRQGDSPDVSLNRVGGEQPSSVPVAGFRVKVRSSTSESPKRSV